MTTEFRDRRPRHRGHPRRKLMWPPKYDLFGVGISATTCDEATAATMDAARRSRPAIVSCHAVHAVVTASDDSSIRDRVNSFEMVTPDGQPVRWALNILHGTGLSDRVYGPELMLRVCGRAAQDNLSIYLYGARPAVVKRLRANLLRAFPALKIVGCEAPPFRPLTEHEDRAVVNRINASGARVLFIGLGCPKQDIFAHDHRTSIRCVQVCVGAAFDLHAGVRAMAPTWMQRQGLEWIYRLAQEPHRLWRRYLTTNSRFILKFAVALWHKSRRQRRWRDDPGQRSATLLWKGPWVSASRTNERSP